MKMLGDIINNFADFSKYFLFIRSKNNTIQRLILNKEQNYIVKKLDAQKKINSKVRAVIVKSRQIGSTTLFAARGYHYTILNKGVRSFVLTHRQSATNNVFDMINRYYKHTPAFLKTQILVNRNKHIVFQDNDSSYIFATAGGSEVGRSDTIQFFHGSEVAYWPNASDNLVASLLAVPNSRNTEIILESTANGPNGIFYEMSLEALNKTSQYQMIFIPWYWHAEYQSYDSVQIPKNWLDYGRSHKLSEAQLKWAYNQNKLISFGSTHNCDDGPSYRFYQEFPADINEAFRYSLTNTLINHDKLRLICIEKKQLLDPQFNKDNNLKLQYQSTIKSVRPIIGVDVAMGGNDSTYIIDKSGNFLGFQINHEINTNDTMEVVGILSNYIKQFNPVKVCIDVGGGGVGVYDRLKELGYNCLQLIHFGAKASNTRKYFNKRAEMWGNLCDFLEVGNWVIKDDALIHQMCAVGFFYNSKGQIQLESKNEVKKKLGKSPDAADAAALTFAHNQVLWTNSGSYVNQSNDYDPLSW